MNNVIIMSHSLLTIIIPITASYKRSSSHGADALENLLAHSIEMLILLITKAIHSVIYTLQKQPRHRIGMRLSICNSTLIHNSFFILVHYTGISITTNTVYYNK